VSLAWEEELARCPLAAGPFPPGDRRCDWCGSDLTGRRRRWCSDECSNAFSTNHAWTSARSAAIRRDKVCQVCGSDGIHEIEKWYAFLVGVCGRWPNPFGRVGFGDWCRANGWFPDHEEAIDAWRGYLGARERPFRVARQMAETAHRQSQLEVNHRVPCLGKHKENSCAHHLDGLVVLCHRCHVIETNRQRRAGLLAS
jgi:hypothetical protein